MNINICDSPEHAYHGQHAVAAGTEWQLSPRLSGLYAMHHVRESGSVVVSRVGSVTWVPTRLYYCIHTHPHGMQSPECLGALSAWHKHMACSQAERSFDLCAAN